MSDGYLSAHATPVNGHRNGLYGPDFRSDSNGGGYDEDLAGIGVAVGGKGKGRTSLGASSMLSEVESFKSAVTNTPSYASTAHWTPPSTPSRRRSEANGDSDSNGRATLAAPESTRTFRSAQSGSRRSSIAGTDTEDHDDPPTPTVNGAGPSSFLATPSHSRNGTPAQTTPRSLSPSPSPASLRPNAPERASSSTSSSLKTKPLPALSYSMTPSTSDGDMTNRRFSNATSNSSAQSVRQNNHPNTLNSSVMTNGGSATSNDPANEIDQTALLIKRLYERLEFQGVPGDGYEEGKERSRDGIINREPEASERESPGQEAWRRGSGVPNIATANGSQRLSVLNSVLPPKEEQILKRVDRYGFFSSSHPAALACQHNRLATLDAAAYAVLSTSKSRPSSKAPSLSASTNSGPPPDCNNLQSRHKNLQHRASTASLMPALNPTDMALETKRIDKWSTMLVVATRDSGNNAKEWDVGREWWDGRQSGNGKYRKLQRRVFKGVPDRWRRAVWGLEMERVAGEAKGKGKEKVMSLEELTAEYRNFISLPSNQDIQIDLDVPRTISGHVLFHTRYGQGQRALFHVLHAFGLHCEDIGGYCQGMGPIAATFLCYFEPERAYACLVRLFYQYGLRHIFAEGFPGLVEAFYVQEKLVELLMPDVFRSFADNGISTSSYATKWYISLFANSVPFATQLRFWDGLLLEGIDFTIITAVAVIWCFRAEFTSPDASFESILSRLSSYFLVESDDALLRWIRKTLRRTDLRKKMDMWRGEWRGFVADGSSTRRVT